jgi:hypothetical protein
LTQQDKHRFSPDELFMLALAGVAHLTAQDIRRLTSDDLVHLQMRGLA